MCSLIYFPRVKPGTRFLISKGVFKPHYSSLLVLLDMDGVYVPLYTLSLVWTCYLM